jgi:hypothetical protein
MHDLAAVVDVIDEVVERADALRQPALDPRPLGGRDDARHEVERERAVAHRSIGVRSGGVERDPLLHEDRVAPAAGRGERVRPELLEGVDERLRVRPGRPVRVQHLVVEALADCQHAGILTSWPVPPQCRRVPASPPRVRPVVERRRAEA